VLAGDPKQLGPIVHSPLSSKYGLSISLLERLIQLPVYRQDRDSFPNSGYNPRVLTKLLNNYRAHPALLHLPNKLFYGGELVAAGNRMRTHSLSTWEHLVTEGVPLIFHGVQGKDQREASSPSWFNISEIEQVIEYVKWLIFETRENRVAAADIGIITPYAKQKQKLRDALAREGQRGNRAAFKEIKVGSTEEFQGQERRVIILTTVRTSRQFVESDAKHNLGFLTNPKRFNVACTRAQALMVVIGDPRVLRDDKHWGSLLNYCVETRAYRGCALPINDDATSDALATQMEDLLRDDAEEGEPESDEGSDDEHEAAPTQRMQQEQLPIERND
jgi:helicase MOV-10